jgi:hypothetical protein
VRDCCVGVQIHNNENMESTLRSRRMEARIVRDARTRALRRDRRAAVERITFPRKALSAEAVQSLPAELQTAYAERVRRLAARRARGRPDRGGSVFAPGALVNLAFAEQLQRETSPAVEAIASALAEGIQVCRSLARASLIHSHLPCVPYSSTGCRCARRTGSGCRFVGAGRCVAGSSRPRSRAIALVHSHLPFTMFIGLAPAHALRTWRADL